jgi:hypothetical protein
MSLKTFIALSCFAIGVSISAQVANYNFYGGNVDVNLRHENLEQINNLYNEIEETRSSVESDRDHLSQIFKSTLGSFVLGAADQYIDDGFNALYEKYFNEGAKDLESFVDASLGQLAQRDENKLNELLETESDSLRTRLIWDKFQENDLFKSVKATMSDRAFKAFSSRAISALAKRTEVLAKEVSNNTLNIDVLKGSYIKFSADVEVRLKALENSSEVQADADESALKIQEKAEKASRTPSSVDNPVPEFASNQDKKKVKEDTKEAKDNLKEMAVEFKKFNGYLNQSYKIAINLGLKGKDAERFQDVLKISNVSLSLVAAFAAPEPGNILNATIAITSLFAKNKPSPEAIRHQQIMEAFDVVFENQKMILENQKQIIENQQMLLDTMLEIQKHNEQWFFSINKSFDKVLGNQSIMLESIRAVHEDEQAKKSCRAFLNSRFRCSPEDLDEEFGDLKSCRESIVNRKGNFLAFNNQNSRTDILVRGRFKSYESLAKHFFSKKNSEYYKDCSNALLRIFSSGEEEILMSSYYSVGDTTLFENQISPVLYPLVDLVEATFTNRFTPPRYHERSLNSLLISLTEPQVYDSFNGNRASLIKKTRVSKRFLNKGLTLRKLKNLYFVPSVNQYVNYLLEVLPYYSLVKKKHYWDDTLVLRSPEELVEDMTDVSDEVIDSLRNAYHFVNLGIVQYSLMSGSQILDKISSAILLNNEVFKDRLIQAIISNDVLRNNFLVYEIGKTLKFTRLDPEKSYKENFEENIKLYEDYVTKEASSCKFDFSKNSYGSECKSDFIKKITHGLKFNGKSVVLMMAGKQVSLPLPSVQSMKEQKMSYPKEVLILLELKRELRSAINQVPQAKKIIMNELPYVM